jgi:hypothetical protein
VAHFRPQSGQHRALDGLEIEGLRIATGAALGGRGAADPDPPRSVLSVRRHAGAAGSAPEQPGQHVPWAPLLIWMGVAARFLAPLRSLENGARDDR